MKHSIFKIIFAAVVAMVSVGNAFAQSTPPNDEIWYTSKSGQVVTPNETNVFGATIESNTYSAGKGVIKFSGNVTSIGEWAFCNCSSLASITIPNSVTSIEYEAFYGCSSLASITIPNSVTSIGEWAFAGCSSLASITIPNSVKSIGSSAFYNCSRLASITIPNSVTSIGDEAFARCSSLASIKVDADNTVYDSRDNCNAIIKTSSNELIRGCKNTTIPNSVTSIGGYAFYGCSSLASITIPNSVKSIGDGAFYGCSNVKELIYAEGTKTF